MDSRFPTFRRWANIVAPIPAWTPKRASTAQRQALLRLIAVATEEKLPLSPLLEAWATDERGPQKHGVRRLAELLKSGTPLPEAIEQTPGALRDEDLLAIRFDSQLGTRTAAVRETIDDAQPSPANQPSQLRRTLAYFGTVLVLAITVIAFVQIKITPEFEKILEEFSLNTPDTFWWSNRFFGTMARYWWLGAIALFVVLWSMFSATPGRIIRSTFLGRIVSPFRESLSADVLKKLGIAALAGRPIPSVLSTLARYHFDPIIRQKLLFVRNEVEQGVDVWKSLAAVGLLTLPEIRVLSTAERVGNRSWVLEQLADVKQRRATRRLERLSEILLPMLVLLMGGFVLVQALTVFLPLTEILSSLL